MENQESLLAKLEVDIAQSPVDLETQISSKQDESEQLAQVVSNVQIEISQIEGRIQQVVQNRQR